MSEVSPRNLGHVARIASFRCWRFVQVTDDEAKHQLRHVRLVSHLVSAKHVTAEEVRLRQ